MKCVDARTQFADVLLGGTDAISMEFEEHVASCQACRDELDVMRTHWAALGVLDDAEPGPGLRRGFYQALEAYQSGFAERQPSWFTWWPKAPALQAALGMAMLLIGVFAGYLLSNRYNPQVAQLQEQVNSLHQVMALSLLEQQSAFSRLEGVAWSYRVERSDTEVLDALLRTVNGDASVDVRLAAVDALRQFSTNASTRRGLAQALPHQTSPLVQIALIDLLVELQERSAAPQLRQLVEEPALDQNVQARAQRALLRLE
jgi:hypothetical protein